MHLDFIATAALRATALLALGLIAIRLLPACQPQWRRGMALLCLAASLVLPFLSMPKAAVGLVIPASKSLTGGVNGTLAGNILTLCWALGVLGAGVGLARRVHALRKWIRACDVIEASRLNLPLRVLISPGLPAPCLAGFISPVLVVPEGARGWTSETWRCVLAHELQHRRQGDLFLGWIAHLARVLYWWHPLAGRLERELGLECELCCDQAVLRQGVGALDYARELLRFTPNGDDALPGAFSMSGKHVSSLRLRLERMLGAQPDAMGRWCICSVVALILFGVTGTAWLGFERSPSVIKTNEQVAEAKLRLGANPFPADPR